MYGTLPAFRTYAAARGDQGPTTASDAVATAALTRASDYVRTRYVTRFRPGYDETLPEVEEATYIAGQIELQTPGAFATRFTPGASKLLVQFATIRWQPVDGPQVGVLPREAMVPVDSRIEALLAPYLWPVMAGHHVA